MHFPARVIPDTNKSGIEAMATQQDLRTSQATAQEHVAAAEHRPAIGQPVRRRRFSLRGFTSLLLSFAFLAMCVSGAMLFVTPRGRVANWSDWSLLGLTKHEWGSVHVNNSVLFVVIAVIHLFLNWSVLIRYIKNKAATGVNMKKELALAGVVAAVCLAGPIWSVPPFSTVMSLNENIKNYWEQGAAQPPVPHAEELTLAELADTIQLDVRQMSAALEKEGYVVDSDDQTIGELGKQKGVAPSTVFAAIRKHHPSSRGWGRVDGQVPGSQGHSAAGPGAKAGQGPLGGGKRGAGTGEQRPGWGPGRASGPVSDLGEVTLSDLASGINITDEELFAALAAEGYEAGSAALSLRQLSEQKDVSPDDVLEAIRGQFPNTRGWGRITGRRGH